MKVRLGTFQVVALLASLWSTGIPLTLPVVASRAGSGAWLSYTAGWIVAFVVGGMLSALHRAIPNQDLVELTHSLLGRRAGALVGVLLALYFAQVAAIALRHMADQWVGALMPETPMIVFLGLTAVLSGYALKRGIEVVARAAGVLFFVAAMGFVLFTTLLLRNVSLQELGAPVGKGLGPAMAAAGVPIAFSGEVVVLGMLLPALKPSHQLSRAVGLGLLFFGLGALTPVVLSLTIFGPAETARLTDPVLELLKLIEIGRFLEHVEAIFLGLWQALVLVKLFGFHYACLASLNSVLRLEDSTALTWPLTVLILNLSLWGQPTLSQVVEFKREVGPWFSAAVGLVLPLVLLGAARKFLDRRSGGPGNPVPEEGQP